MKDHLPHRVTLYIIYPVQQQLVWDPAASVQCFSRDVLKEITEMHLWCQRWRHCMMYLGLERTNIKWDPSYAKLSGWMVVLRKLVPGILKAVVLDWSREHH